MALMSSCCSAADIERIKGKWGGGERRGGKESGERGGGHKSKRKAQGEGVCVCTLR
jgi:hypothetical protein